MAKIPQNDRDDRGAAERAMLYNRKPESGTAHSRDEQIIKLLEQIRLRIGDMEKERNEFWDALNEQSKTLHELEDRSTSTEKTYLSLENRLSRSELQEAPLVERLTELERSTKEQSKEPDHALHQEILSRMEESDLQTIRLVERIDEALSMQSRLTRRVDKLVQDKQKLTRKLEYLEEGMADTRKALASKAMVLLTDQSVAAKADHISLPVFSKFDETIDDKDDDVLPYEKTNHFDRGQGIETGNLRSSSVLSGITSWKGQVAAVTGFVVLAAFAGWWITQENPSIYKMPLASYEAAQKPEQTAEASSQGINRKVATMRSVQEQPVQDRAYPDIVDDVSVKAETGNDIDSNAYTEIAAARQEERIGAALNNIQPTAGAAVSESGNVAQDMEDDGSYKEVNYASPEKSPVSSEAAITSEDMAQVASLDIKPDASLPKQIQAVEKAAFKGNAEAQHDLAAIYTAGHANVTPNYDRAAYWFEKAAENGVANARYNLGVLYHQGLGVDQNIETALEWYRKAAQLGHPEAQYNLGIAYIEGIGVSYDPKRAAEYFETAAASGITEAAFNLGLIYENGLVGNAQPDEALLWYKTAADNGNVDARRAMEQLAKSMNVKPEDIDRLVEDFKSPAVERMAKAAPSSRKNEAQASKADIDNTISQIQKQLIGLGLYPGPATGELGPLTQDAIRLYQARHDMNVTGEPTEDLLVHMLAKNLRINSGSSMEELGSRER